MWLCTFFLQLRWWWRWRSQQWWGKFQLLNRIVFEKHNFEHTIATAIHLALHTNFNLNQVDILFFLNFFSVFNAFLVWKFEIETKESGTNECDDNANQECDCRINKINLILLPNFQILFQSNKIFSIHFLY